MRAHRLACESLTRCHGSGQQSPTCPACVRATLVPWSAPGTGFHINAWELRHACITDGVDVLDVGPGSGYGCAVLATRLGDGHVTSVDVDE